MWQECGAALWAFTHVLRNAICADSLADQFVDGAHRPQCFVINER